MQRLRSLERLRSADIDTLAAGVHHDGGGLFLRVEDSGSRRWLLRLTLHGKRIMRGLGPYPTVSLQMARDKAVDYRRGAREGKDVARTSRSPTFEQAFEQHFAQRKEGLRNAKHIWQWRSTIETHAFPRIGRRPVREITHDEIVAILRPIWIETPVTAQRLLQRMSIIFDIAVSRGLREKANPCKGVADDLGKQGARVEHHPALPWQEVPGFIQALRTCDANQITKLAFEFLILTATRNGEVRFATRTEIDAGLWTIPASRMKAGVEHVVPLSQRCREIDRSTAGDGLIFPGRGGMTISEMTFINVLRRMGFGERATVHGFRTSFRTWATETNQCREVVAEAALAHAIKDKTVAAYLRTTYLEERIGLMQRWADFCAGGG
jgi:integrase